jgi:RNA polymerase sigma factor (sigma-70 family)
MSRVTFPIVESETKTSMDDTALLSRYVETGCQDSFEEIVSRHSGWIYSLSLRAVKDKHLAEDVTQAVFIILARKADSIVPGTPLSGWLFKTSRFAVSDAIKRRVRMQRRENRAAELFRQTTSNGIVLNEDNVSDEVSAALDEAVGCLSESDRQAVILRFYEGKSLAEVGDALEISEEAAKKRVARAVEKLKKFFTRKGIIASAGVLLMMLNARTAEAAAWTPTISFSAAGASIAPQIAVGAMQLMALAQKRLLGAIVAGLVAVAVSIPLVGFALLRNQASPTVATVSAAADTNMIPLPDVGASIIQEQMPELPKERKWAELYVGYKGQILWRSDLFDSSANPNPFYLKNAHTSDKPYAVAVDRNGQYFIKPLDRGILQSPAIRQSQFDYDQGPREALARMHSMLSIIDTPAATAHGTTQDATFQILAPAPRRHEPLEWHLLRRNDDEGVPIVEYVPKMQMSPAGGGGGGGDGGDMLFRTEMFDGVYVPEPGTGTLLALAGMGLLIRRRRR